MIDKQKVLLELACAALKGGITPDEVLEEVEVEGNIWLIAQQICPDDFHIEDKMSKDNNSCYKY